MIKIQKLVDSFIFISGYTTHVVQSKNKITAVHNTRKYKEIYHFRSTLPYNIITSVVPNLPKYEGSTVDLRLRKKKQDEKKRNE